MNFYLLREIKGRRRSKKKRFISNSIQFDVNKDEDDDDGKKIRIKAIYLIHNKDLKRNRNITINFYFA